MSAIRALEARDIEPVAALYERVARSRTSDTPPGLADYFRRILLDHPWSDPDIPSLVYEGADGRILGFIGSHPRRARLGQQQIRIGCSGQLVSDPSHGSPAVGPLLMRRYLGGPQDLTITDGATPLVSDMWTRLGGFVVHPSSFVWTRLLRPARAAGERLADRAGRTELPRGAAPVLGLLDAATTRWTRPPATDAELESVELTAEALVEHEPGISSGALLRRELDVPAAEWLFREMAAVTTRGRLVRRLIRRAGRPVGWYVAYLRSGGTSHVLDVQAAAGEIDAVFDMLVDDCWRGGSAAVEGRVDPWLFETVARRRLLVRPRERVLYHTREPEIERRVATGTSRLSRLDGEWWMGHHTEPFT